MYFDTSVLLPVYFPEPRSEEAERLLRESGSPMVSDLAFAEFLVALGRKQKLNEITPLQSATVRAAFEGHFARGHFQALHLQPRHFRLAGELAGRSSVILRTLDALHLALAADTGFPLATFDRRLAEAGRGLGFEVAG
ncbi:MAG: type II toxin-antitoxin system VapC family toxin [Thermoanaerobaculia bacterium]|nr:type II toxin-antitoxin system VapC family toxin [Thermoanaerobaculia bacterium]